MEKFKKILEKKDLYIQFSDEEMQELGWAEGQKLSMDYDKETGSILIRPYVKVDMDISDWDREVLEFIVGESCDKDISCNEVIENILKDTMSKMGVKSKESVLLCEDKY